ncbi:MAG: response regulator [Elusimicrobiota bacterium]|jgi:two-component system phosphate regulon response regulator PhoB
MARLLIVDDEQEVVFLMRFILEKAGHTAVTAGNGMQALAALGVEPKDPSIPLPDLVLLDVMMPVMDGYTTSVRMYDDERTRGLPILVVTAHGDTRHLFEGAPNVAGYLQKPFDPKGLREMVAKILVEKKVS